MVRKLITIIVFVLVTAALVVGGVLIAPCVKDVSAPKDNSLKLTVMSYNIRTVDLTASPDSPDFWTSRQDALIKHILENDPDIIGVQEVFNLIQDVFLEENLTKYDNVGISRDGETAFFSEKNLIFYKRDKFELIETNTFWLSDTPDVVSRGWDGACNRICTYAVLKDKATGKIVKFFNTHFDHKGAEARQKGSAMVTEAVANSEHPAILTGDFNFDEKNPAYAAMTQKLDDTKYLAESVAAYGTFHAYSDADLSQKSPIDFCMVKPGDFIVQSYKVLYGKHYGVFTSDHYAVKVTLTLP